MPHHTLIGLGELAVVLEEAIGGDFHGLAAPNEGNIDLG